MNDDDEVLDSHLEADYEDRYGDYGYDYDPNLCDYCDHAPKAEGSTMCASCIDHWARIDAHNAVYAAQYPNYCRTCLGYGMIHDPGVYRYPDGSGEPPSDDPCDNCVGQGKCPRCGAETITEEQYEQDAMQCEACGWNESSPGYAEG